MPWAAGWCPMSCGYCDPDSASPPAPEQPVPAPPAAEEPQPSPASPAAEEPQPSPASPAAEEPAPASLAVPRPSAPTGSYGTPSQPGSYGTPAPRGSPAPSPAVPRPSPPAGSYGRPTQPGSYGSPAPSGSPAPQPVPASPAAEEPEPTPASPTAEPAPVPAESPASPPATEQPAPASPAAPQPSAPTGSYGTPAQPGGYGASPAPTAAPSPSPQEPELRLTTAAVCLALACLTLPPSGERLLTLPGVATCPADTPCRLPAIECPSGCSAHGACHVSAGACVCFEVGWEQWGWWGGLVGQLGAGLQTDGGSPTLALPSPALMAVQGYTGADCASCALGWQRAASGSCERAEQAAPEVGGQGWVGGQGCAPAARGQVQDSPCWLHAC